MCCVSSSPDPVLRPVTVCLVSAPEPLENLENRVQRVGACGPVLYLDMQLLLFESFGGFGKGVGEILRKAANERATKQADAGPVPR